MKTKLIVSAFVITSLTLATAGMSQGVTAQAPYTAQAARTTHSRVSAANAPDSQFVLKVGVAVVAPKSNNGTLNSPLGDLATSIGSCARPSISLEYLVMQNGDIGTLGVELLGAYPFHNNISLNGAKIASVNVLPPTLTVQYHFLPGKIVSPFAGIGLNYALMYGGKINLSSAGINDAGLHVGNSWGVAPHAGVECNINKNWLVSIDARWIGMKNTVRLTTGGASYNLGSVNVDPWVFGVQIGCRF